MRLSVVAAGKRRQRLEVAVLPNGPEPLTVSLKPTEILSVRIKIRSFGDHRDHVAASISGAFATTAGACSAAQRAQGVDLPFPPYESRLGESIGLGGCCGSADDGPGVVQAIPVGVSAA